MKLLERIQLYEDNEFFDGGFVYFSQNGMDGYRGTADSVDTDIKLSSAEDVKKDSKSKIFDLKKNIIKVGGFFNSLKQSENKIEENDGEKEEEEHIKKMNDEDAARNAIAKVDALESNVDMRPKFRGKIDREFRNEGGIYKIGKDRMNRISLSANGAALYKKMGAKKIKVSVSRSNMVNGKPKYDGSPIKFDVAATWNAEKNAYIIDSDRNYTSSLKGLDKYDGKYANGNVLKFYNYTDYQIFANGDEKIGKTTGENVDSVRNTIKKTVIEKNVENDSEKDIKGENKVKDEVIKKDEKNKDKLGLVGIDVKESDRKLSVENKSKRIDIKPKGVLKDEVKTVYADDPDLEKHFVQTPKSRDGYKKRSVDENRYKNENKSEELNKKKDAIVENSVETRKKSLDKDVKKLGFAGVIGKKFTSKTINTGAVEFTTDALTQATDSLKAVLGLRDVDSLILKMDGKKIKSFTFSNLNKGILNKIESSDAPESVKLFFNQIKDFTPYQLSKIKPRFRVDGKLSTVLVEDNGNPEISVIVDGEGGKLDIDKINIDKLKSDFVETDISKMGKDKNDIVVKYVDGEIKFIVLNGGVNKEFLTTFVNKVNRYKNSKNVKALKEYLNGSKKAFDAGKVFEGQVIDLGNIESIEFNGSDITKISVKQKVESYDGGVILFDGRTDLTGTDIDFFLNMGNSIKAIDSYKNKKEGSKDDGASKIKNKFETKKLALTKEALLKNLEEQSKEFNDKYKLLDKSKFTMRIPTLKEISSVKKRFSNTADYKKLFNNLAGGKGVLLDSKNNALYVVSGALGSEKFITVNDTSIGKKGVGSGKFQTSVGYFKFKKKWRGVERRVVGAVVSNLDLRDKIFREDRVRSVDKGRATMTTLALEVATNPPRGIAVHGTNKEGKLSQNASHGCIRTSNSDIISLASLNGYKPYSGIYITPVK